MTYLGAMNAVLGKGFEMTVFQILNLRSEWEELARGLDTDIDSTVSGLKCFMEHSHKRNRFKPNWDDAMEVAEYILDNVK